MKNRVVISAILLLLSLVLVGCAQTVQIGSLVGDPARWVNKTVRIEGTVQNSFGGLGRGAYAVSDGTGTIWVASAKGIPASGMRVAVEGEVFQGFQFMGQSFGVALRETQHRSR